MIRKIRMEKIGRSLGFKPPIGSGESSPARLFREATQLKTADADVRVVGIEILRTEIQIRATIVVARIVERGRPAESDFADIAQYAMRSCAEARGGVPGERGSRARGAYLVETTVSSLVMA